ncbi:CHASE2 domain-containing protein [Microseira sp. BLCC-F43]|uniref:CHASE2 domain-containing protein n=1 Tax=Microseira sp. BLCC-F43 TaxID=3153602 RepID=UPI0035B9A8AB
MSRLVVLNLANGDLYNGFPAVSAQVWNYGARLPMRCTGCLPAAPEISKLYRSWQLLYEALCSRLCPRIEIEVTDVTNVSQIEFRDLCQQLSNKINIWLNSESFRNIDQRLRTQLDPDEEIRFIIETNDNLLRRIPWHLWKFFEDYPKAEVALSAPEYRQPDDSGKRRYGKVRILAVFGDRTGIDIEKDRMFLSQLSRRVETEFLVEPQPEDLDDRLRQDWDILFFAGHSSSQEQGLIRLNKTESLTLDQLRHALKKAIDRGLQLAIFNSCDGLGLVKSLEELHIPQAIAMREPVPDAIAHAFLKYFLVAFFLEEQSLYASVREARERLQKLEKKYPCATWLPVICQNPATEPFSWQTSRGLRNSLPISTRIQTVLLTSILVTVSIMGVRNLGVLQPLELSAFDYLMSWRPPEKPEPRILIVTVTENDVQNQNPQERRGASISDRSLAKLLEKLQQHQPQAIGLDIYRDFPVEQKYAKLTNYMKQNQRFIAVCEVGGNKDHSGTRPPPGMPKSRLSFSDIPVDPDRVIRRQLLGMTVDPKSFCATDTSFSLRVAEAYLAAKGIQSQRNQDEDLQIGSVVFKKLETDAGGYQQIDARGYQIMLNYRASQVVAQQITLSEILSDRISTQLPNLVKNRIILIGTTAPSFKDYFPTPYTTIRASEEMPGVIIQAHMVSQILSAVLDRRPLLWWLPASGEIIWVWSWSLVGILTGYIRSSLRLVLAGSATIFILCGICFVMLLNGGWMPLVPSVFALVIGLAVMAYMKAEKPG